MTADLQLWLRKVGRFRPKVCRHLKVKTYERLDNRVLVYQCIECGAIATVSEVEQDLAAYDKRPPTLRWQQVTV